mmetsp:Transcript_31472/g.99804  ORF Transcript_31472/g.99804 Transcript_31472/m.99804 type:complete len:229 (-) Transcript_31472:221-907(-)
MVIVAPLVVAPLIVAPLIAEVPPAVVPTLVGARSARDVGERLGVGHRKAAVVCKAVRAEPEPRGALPGASRAAALLIVYEDIVEHVLEEERREVLAVEGRVREEPGAVAHARGDGDALAGLAHAREGGHEVPVAAHEQADVEGVDHGVVEHVRRQRDVHALLRRLRLRDVHLEGRAVVELAEHAPPPRLRRRVREHGRVHHAAHDVYGPVHALQLPHLPLDVARERLR